MDEVKKEKKVENIYLDGITLNFGPYDFSILGTKVKRDIDTSGQVTEVQNLETEIRMSPQLAKALWIILGNSIAQYESQFDKIPDILKIANESK